MKHFIQAQNVRAGSPTMTFVVYEGGGYWMGTYHTLNAENPTGVGEDYDGIHKMRISQETYDALVKQSRLNKTRPTNG